MQKEVQLIRETIWVRLNADPYSVIDELTPGLEREQIGLHLFLRRR